MLENPTPIIAGTRIGHVHLKVADLDRALGFYCGVLGFELMQRVHSGAAFISAGGDHHPNRVETWGRKSGHSPAPGKTGAVSNPVPLSNPRAAAGAAIPRHHAGRSPARG